MSRISLALRVWTVPALLSDGPDGVGGLGLADALKTGPDMLAAGGWLGAGVVAAESAPAVTTQADNTAAATNTAQSSLGWGHWFLLAPSSSAPRLGELRLGELRLADPSLADLRIEFFMQRFSSTASHVAIVALAGPV